MGFLGTVVYVALLLLNAIAILSEERFLARVGWSTLSPSSISHPLSSNNGFGTVSSYGDPNSGPGGVGGMDGNNGGAGVKARMINLIAAVRTLMRLPLIVANVVIIVYELILG